MMDRCLQQSRAAPNPTVMQMSHDINSTLFWRFHNLILLSVCQSWDLKWHSFSILIIHLSCSFSEIMTICNNILKVQSRLPLLREFSQVKSSNFNKIPRNQERFSHTDFAMDSSWSHKFAALTKRKSWLVWKWLLFELGVINHYKT